MLNDHIIVVTGGAGLLGKELCKAIAKSGGTPIVADLDTDRAKLVCDEINQNNERDIADYCFLDITKVGSIDTVIADLSKKYGRIDCLVNNAYPRNKNYGRKFLEVEYEDFCENLNLNIGGYFLITQLLAKYFLKQGYGNIVNISSIYGHIAPRFEMYDETSMTMPVEYAVIKAGLNNLTQYLAKLFKGKNIRVNAISPGGIFNGQDESFLNSYQSFCLNKGMLDSTDISGTLLFLISKDSQYINGQNIIVDDGFSL